MLHLSHVASVCGQELARVLSSTGRAVWFSLLVPFVVTVLAKDMAVDQFFPSPHINR